jgi:DNA-binding NtrC family response regulator
VASGEAGLKALKGSDFAAMILDIGLPDMSGLDLLGRLRKDGSELPVLVITAHATLQHVIDSQKSGATAYLTKPLDMRQFQKTLDSILAPCLVIEDTAAQGDVVADSMTLIGASPALRETFLGIARACSGTVPVLINGPSGSGKSLAASVIHAHGSQSSDPLVVTTCSQIQQASVFDDMPRGTWVLDEITDLKPELQALLAERLADPSGMPTRVIATTAADPLVAARDGRLREDLYYALSALSIPMPPLSERSTDIPALCGFFACLRGGSNSPQLTPPVMAAMQAYGWPGNVRELRHVIDYALSMSHGGPVFLSHLPKHVAAAAGSSDEGPVPSELESVFSRWLDAVLSQPEEDWPSYDELLAQLEGTLLKQLLERNDHRPTRLATTMRMHRATLRQKLQRAGLQRKDEV